MSKNIGISNNRLEHTISVARKCYELAKNEYKRSEEDARKCFLMGFLHDIGYEFSENSKDHPQIGADILTSFNNIEWDQMVFAIMTHGDPDRFLDTTAQAILNEADMTINSHGQSVNMEERCAEIKRRYGDNSRQYNNAVEICKKINDFKESNRKDFKGE